MQYFKIRAIPTYSVWLSAVLLFLIGSSCQSLSTQTSTNKKDTSSILKEIQNAHAGQIITIPNGIYTDAELVFTGNGTEDEPITLQAETNGKVFLEGNSSIHMSGEHLILKGIVFRNGYTTIGEVISLRTTSEELCNNCRVTECVIDNYNNPERYENDLWLVIYGKNNRIDHNHLSGKRNLGVTMAVRLNSKESQENNHQIDHNYFGPRPVFGSNGGETLRIGTSHHSMSNSNTLVEYNYFDRCNGEHEIISNKSCQNTFRNNTFFECQGTLTMRHGNETLVEDNYFFGNGKANTGGIRIINESQTVKNNYGEGLTGYRFRGGLVVMNGVPNSPINRYFPVINSSASNNTFVNCDYIQLCAGADEERSSPPTSSSISNNIFYNTKKNDIFTVYDDVSGIKFTSNIVSPNVELFQQDGFKKEDVSFKRIDGILVPQSATLQKIGRQGPVDRATLEIVGVDWYPRSSETTAFHTGTTTKVSGTGDELYAAIIAAKDGDILEVAKGEYTIRKAIKLSNPISIIGDGQTRSDVKIYFERGSLFNLENGGALQLTNLTIDGSKAPDYSGNSVIRTSRYSMIENYKLLLKDCDFVDLDINHSFNVLEQAKSTFADSIQAIGCNFRNISGSVFELTKETEDRGIYGVENMVIQNCNFQDIGKAAINLYRGGGDESTFGPILQLEKSTFTNVGQDKRNKSNSAVKIHGVQYAEFYDNTWTASKPLDMYLSVGEPLIKLKGNDFSKSASIVSNSKAYKLIK